MVTAETHAGADDRREQRYREARGVTVLGAVVNLGLSVGKLIAGTIGHSAALVADGLHSLSDLVSDAVVLISMRVSSREADEDHPYGHGRFETLATLFVAVAILVVAVGIVLRAIERLDEPLEAAPEGVALAAALISILAKEALYWITVRKGRAIQSSAVIANAWHHRSDAVSSVAALAGIGGAMAGFPAADPVAAIVVALILGRVGLAMARPVFHELTGSTHAIDREVRSRIESVIQGMNEVRSAHTLKARRVGPDILVDVHVVVDPRLSVSEGHQIADKLRRDLLEEVDGVTDVLVHVDTEDDQAGPPIPLYPGREEFTRQVRALLAELPSFTALEVVTPHFGSEGIDLEIAVSVEENLEVAPLRRSAEELCRRLLAEVTDLRRVTVHLVLADRSVSSDELSASTARAPSEDAVVPSGPANEREAE